MISVIICSRDPSKLHELEEHLRATIGVPYELIIIDNSGNQFNIFSAYNQGARESRYELLCFMHEDICYHTPGWGRNVIKYFEDPDVGMIGIAGSAYLSAIPGGWWASGFKAVNLIQSESTGARSSERQYTGPDNGEPTPVAVVDGVWMCIRKTLFNTICFDEKTFNGYHFYDLDICLQVGQCHKKILVVYDVLLEHFSWGGMRKSWLAGSLVFNDKWKKQLPLNILALPLHLTSSFDRKVYLELIHWLNANQYPAVEKQKILKAFYPVLKPAVLSLDFWKIVYHYCRVKIKVFIGP